MNIKFFSIIMICSGLSVQATPVFDGNEQSFLQKLTKVPGSQEISGEKKLSLEELKFEKLISFNEWLDRYTVNLDIDDQELEIEPSDHIFMRPIDSAFAKLLNHELLSEQNVGIEVAQGESLIEFLTRKYLKYTGPKSSEILLDYVDVIVPSHEEFQKIVESYMLKQPITLQDLGLITTFGERLIVMQSDIISFLQNKTNFAGKKHEQESSLLFKINQILDAAQQLDKELKEIEPFLINTLKAVDDTVNESSFAPSRDPEVQENIKTAGSVLKKLKEIKSDFNNLSSSLFQILLKPSSQDGNDWEIINS